MASALSRTWRPEHRPRAWGHGRAYINPDRDPLTNTLLYDIDASRESEPVGGSDVLAVQVPANAGSLNTIGRHRLDTGSIVGFDIGPQNEALAALQLGPTSSNLVTIDLLSGRASDLGRIGGRRSAQLITGLAIEIGPQCDACQDDDDSDDDD